MTPAATASPPVVLRVGHSPDADDAFMFYALTHDKIDTGGLTFLHQLEDIQTLNQRALRGELEISAVSIHAYAHLTTTYALLASGSSMGDNYGPIVVTREPLPLEEIRARRVPVAIPGHLTTAYLTLQLCLGKDHPVTVMPFDAIMPAVIRGEIPAGLIIHEGQVTYQDAGVHLAVDLGVWWRQRTGLPLPLGGNVVRRDLGEDLIQRVATLLKQSIQYALDHRAEALEYAMKYAHDVDPARADRFVGMYVNHWTLDYGDIGRQAVRTLLDLAAAEGLVPGPLDIQFVG
jgi:1,4-dihydroxy-6-naphthoate synthase